MKETVLYKGTQHVQFNSMYVCMLKVAGEQHGIMAQAQRGEIVDWGFLGSQNSASIDRGGGGGEGENVARGQQEGGGGWNRGVGGVESIQICIVYFSSTIIY